MKIAIVGAGRIALAKGREFAFVRARRKDAANQNAHPRVGVFPAQEAESSGMIGGIRETQEMLDLFARHGGAADVDVISIRRSTRLTTACSESDMRCRFVTDLASLKSGAP